MNLPWMAIFNPLFLSLLSLITVISSNPGASAVGPVTLLGMIFASPFEYDSHATKLEPWETCGVQEITTAFKYRHSGRNSLILCQNSLPSLLIIVITSRGDAFSQVPMTIVRGAMDEELRALNTESLDTKKITEELFSPIDVTFMLEGRSSSLKAALNALHRAAKVPAPLKILNATIITQVSSKGGPRFRPAVKLITTLLAQTFREVDGDYPEEDIAIKTVQWKAESDETASTNLKRRNAIWCQGETINNHPVVMFLSAQYSSDDPMYEALLDWNAEKEGWYPMKPQLVQSEVHMYR